MTILVGIPAKNLPECWNEVQHFVASACERSNGKYQPIDVLKDAIKGNMQIWAGADEDGAKVKSLAITEIANYPRIKLARLLVATGENPADMVDHVEAIEGWAKENGCQRIEAITRLGWKKFLESRGYKISHVVYEKVIKDDEIQA